MRPIEAICERRVATWLVAALLGLYVWMAASVSSRHSVTVDELAHITAGYAYWTRNDYRLQPENGNLPQRLGALPLLLGDVRFPERDLAWQVSDVWKAGFDFFYTSGNAPNAMLQLCRAAMTPLGALAGLGVFLWSRRLWGTGGALVSLTLWCFCPNALAHGGLVTSDMAAAVAFLGAITLAWWAMQRITAARVFAAGAAAGLLALSKFSAPLLAPVILVLALVRVAFGPRELLAGSRIVRGAVAKLAVIGAAQFAALIVALAIVWSAYGWRSGIYSPSESPGLIHQFVGREVLEKRNALPIQVVRWARDLHVIPEAYALGFAHSYAFSKNRRSFFNGEYRADGWVGFFPYLAWVKTPPAAWLLLLLASGGAVAFFLRRGPTSSARLAKVATRLYLAAPLFVFACIYASSALSSGLNIGHRHILPLYPIFYVLLGAAWPLLARESPLGKTTVVLLTVTFAAESAATRPGYLSYFNAFDGGAKQAYRRVVDSSLDWGQDLPALKDWLASNPTTQPVFLSYFGSADPAGEGLRVIRVADDDSDWRPRSFPVEMKPGVYCVSATMLQQVYTQARGPWDETRRNRLNQLERRFAATRDGSAPPMTSAELIALEHHRFAQLCAHLRQREPDARAADSILIYFVSDAEFAAATDQKTSASSP